MSFSQDQALELTSTTASDVEWKELEDIHLSFGGHLFLNWSNSLVQKEMLHVFHFWTRLGVDGFYLKNVHLFQVQVIEDIYTIFSSILSVVDPQATQRHNFADDITLDKNSKEAVSSVSVKDSSSQNKSFRRILIASRSSLKQLQHRHQYESEYLSMSSASSWIQEESEAQVLSSSLRLQEDPSFISGEKRASSSASVSKSLFDPTVISSPSLSPHSSTTRNSKTTVVRKGVHRNVYSYFHLIDTFLDLKMNTTEDLRDRVNEIFLNEPESSPWILWSLGSVTSSRLVTRIDSDLVVAASFLLFMMPGSVSILYGDEIALRPAIDGHSKKVSTYHGEGTTFFTLGFPLLG